MRPAFIRKWIAKNKTYSLADAKRDADHDYCVIFGVDGEKHAKMTKIPNPKLDELFSDAVRPAALERLLGLTSKGYVFRSHYDATPKRQRAKS